jgi:predicted amidohydrolase YtcJ
VTPETPVAVVRLDQHMLVLTSLALKLAGIDRNTPDPEGSVIGRYESGEHAVLLAGAYGHRCGCGEAEVAVHAIGDAANDLILTIYDEIARTKTPGASEAPHS